MTDPTPHDPDHCCRPPTETELDSNAVRSAAEDVRKYSRWTSRIEVALVATAALAFILAAAFGAYSVAQLRTLAEANRQRATEQIEGQRFAIDAVNCIRYVLIEHRYVNQVYHDLLLEHFGLPQVEKPLEPVLPRRPTSDEITKACQVFEPPPIPGEPLPTTTTTATTTTTITRRGR